jgi:hypothetical protein
MSCGQHVREQRSRLLNFASRWRSVQSGNRGAHLRLQFLGPNHDQPARPNVEGEPCLGLFVIDDDKLRPEL